MNQENEDGAESDVYSYDQDADRPVIGQPRGHLRNDHCIVSCSSNEESPPKYYIKLAWIVACCCYTPIGVKAVKKSKDTRDAILRQDFARAEQDSKEAKLLIKKAILIGIVCWTVIAGLVTLALYLKRPDLFRLS